MLCLTINRSFVVIYLCLIINNFYFIDAKLVNKKSDNNSNKDKDISKSENSSDGQNKLANIVFLDETFFRTPLWPGRKRSFKTVDTSRQKIRFKKFTKFLKQGKII